MPVHDAQRVGEPKLLGAESRFEASVDGGRTWRAFATVLDLELHFPAVTRAELDAVTNAFARTLARYVPDAKLDEAEAFVRGELGVVGLERG